MLCAFCLLFVVGWFTGTGVLCALFGVFLVMQHCGCIVCCLIGLFLFMVVNSVVLVYFLIFICLFCDCFGL